MNLTINFHQLESTPAIKEMVEKKSQKLTKFFNRPFDLTWTLSTGKDGHQSRVLLSGNGLNINAESVKDDLYKTFDDAVTKLERQLVKHKNITKDHMHQPHRDLNELYETETDTEEEI